MLVYICFTYALLPLLMTSTVAQIQLWVFLDMCIKYITKSIYCQTVLVLVADTLFLFSDLRYNKEISILCFDQLPLRNLADS